MEVYVYEGKEEKGLLEKAIIDLNVTEEDILYKTEEKKAGLFKGTVYKLSIIKISEILIYLKDYLATITKDMGLEVTFETNIRNKQVTIKMFSDNNAILIGKNGQTLSALTLLCKQALYTQLGIYVYINLDVENYKDKQIGHLERLAKNIAREVRLTQTPVIMDSMNSYERRIVHNILTNFKGVKTESEGEEPNRHIIVKPVKE